MLGYEAIPLLPPPPHTCTQSLKYYSIIFLPEVLTLRSLMALFLMLIFQNILHHHQRMWPVKLWAFSNLLIFPLAKAAVQNFMFHVFFKIATGYKIHTINCNM